MSRPGADFTGERLHAGDPRFALDLARHRAPYERARERLAGRRVLDLGCGSGHGSALLAGDAGLLVALDRIFPDPEPRRTRARFCRADLFSLPLRPGSFDAVLSFQVIEHLEDPGPYLRAIAALLAPGGQAWISTPNRALSDGVNPYHVREYLADELCEVLRVHFEEVEMLGVGATHPVREVLEERSRRIRRVMRIDPLGLHRRLPQAWIERLFALGALLVRRGGAPAEAPPPSWRDFPIQPPDEATSLDWLAVCRKPRR